ncbi:MAG: hypothetical protein JWM34_1660 [Ilumatobacteraceae bacterium]|nr:hypothetical protein [Ilumatobacteraceae bacterium]
MSMKRAGRSDGHAHGGGDVAGWYPDPTDPSGLRYWDGATWTDHRAKLAAPVSSGAVCSCGVVATGSCRVCNQPFCRAHISEQAREDRAYRKRWDAWICGGCIEDGRRQIRAEQLAKCESVAPRMASLGKIRKVRTFTGLRPRRTTLFGQQFSGRRQVREAKAYLIEYDSGEEHSTYAGLAMSRDGTTIYEVGVPLRGVASARLGPKRSRAGYELRSTITIDLLREAEIGSTSDNWFEHAARAFLRGARRLRIEPDLSQPLPRPELPTDDAIDATSTSEDDTGGIDAPLAPPAVITDPPLSPPAFDDASRS